MSMEQDDVIWTGHLSGEMKAAALAAADVFALPVGFGELWNRCS